MEFSPDILSFQKCLMISWLLVPLIYPLRVLPLASNATDCIDRNLLPKSYYLLHQVGVSGLCDLCWSLSPWLSFVQPRLEGWRGVRPSSKRRRSSRRSFHRATTSAADHILVCLRFPSRIRKNRYQPIDWRSMTTIWA